MMARRLVDTYRQGEDVEVYFAFDDEEGEWRRARVMALQHPGVWVTTEIDQKLWFVTNGKRIRQLNRGPRPEAS